MKILEIKRISFDKGKTWSETPKFFPSTPYEEDYYAFVENLNINDENLYKSAIDFCGYDMIFRERLIGYIAGDMLKNQQSYESIWIRYGGNVKDYHEKMERFNSVLEMFRNKN